MITIENLSFGYPKTNFLAIDDINATIRPGIHLLLGENGAGKTTLLRLLAGLIQPKSGSVKLDEANVDLREPSLLNRIFFLPDRMALPTRTIREFADFNSKFYPNFSSENFEQNLKDFGLTGNEEFASQSLGNSHKTLLSYVLALGVDLLLLDEPANGIDITSKKALRQMLARCIGDDQTVIISTHTVSDLRELYDGVLVLSLSHLLLCMPSWEISERVKCVSTPIPPRDVLFMEQSGGMFHSLVENTDGQPSDLNYSLLYSALLSKNADKILSVINKKESPTPDGNN